MIVNNLTHSIFQTFNISYCQYTETSMFLRSNLRTAGLVDGGAQFQGTYVAAVEDEMILAVAAHYWNGMIVVQAPIHLQAVVRQLMAQSHRAIAGMSGPATQVQATREALGLANRPTQLDECDKLFALQLHELCVPHMLRSGRVQCRLPATYELELLVEWCIAFSVETLGEVETSDLRQSCEQVIEMRQAMGVHWVLLDGETAVSYSAFNACLPDTVQVGGVWTPPAFRGNGYAKYVIAGFLLSEREQKVKRAILFTAQHNKAAQAVYRGLGFQLIPEEYGLLRFKDAAE
ncbi:GNAT family N-acetyltransferase [Tolypothrix bouteillei VB521301_2]